jgi:methylmalonyl-CoA/ethylmalonyl-CoA epimerase
MTGRAQGIDHVAIAVADADDAARRFAALLGLSVVGDEIVDDVGVRLVYLAGTGSSGSTTLQLVQPLRSGPVRDHLELHGEGLHHVCFAVSSIPSMLAGLPGETQARIFTGGRNRPACFLITQPSGTLVELVEHA